MPDEIFYFRESKIPPTLPDIPPEICGPLRRGLLEGLLVRIVHQGERGEATERTILPEVLFRTNGTWYVAAFCHTRQEARTFRLDRILVATLTDVRETSHGIAQDLRDNDEIADYLRGLQCRAARRNHRRSQNLPKR